MKTLKRGWGATCNCLYSTFICDHALDGLSWCAGVPCCCSISVTFVSEKDGSETTVKAPIGQHLLEVAHKNDIELEGAPPQHAMHAPEPDWGCEQQHHLQSAARAGHRVQRSCAAVWPCVTKHMATEEAATASS